MLNWKILAVVVIATAAIVPCLAQKTDAKIVDQKAANLQAHMGFAEGHIKTDRAAKPKERRRVMHKNFRAIRESYAKRSNARNSGSAASYLPADSAAIGSKSL